MTRTPTPWRTRRRTLVATGLALATMASLLGSTPAEASPAPLVTTDGLGIRVDENAIVGPALEAIETAMQPTVNQMIRDGAVAQAPVSGYNNLLISSNLELGFDFVNAGTPGYPSGGLKVHADIQNIEIQYRKKAWWHSECGIWVRPNTGTIDASAKVDKTRLPATPLALNPISATWDDDPDVSTSGACWTYLIDDFFDSFFGSGGEESVARRIERDLNGRAQELIDDLWADHVAPVMNSLNEFGISVNQLRTDDHGLVVTADVDATNGLLLPGGVTPTDVTNAQDSGATSSVNALLANRSSGATVSIHPNVANQFLYALTRSLSGQFGNAAISDSIEDVLLDPSVHGAYADAGWTVTLAMTGTDAPFVQPTGAGGAPQATFNPINVVLRNTSKGSAPVAVFRGSIGAVNLKTIVRPGGTSFGPSYDSSAATASLTRVNGNADVVAFNASPSVVLPYAKVGLQYFDEAIFQQYVSLAPIQIGGLSVTLCTTCGRFAGDQRYTETFTVS